MLMRELASEISLDSLGSSHSLFFPHFNIELESLFYKRKHTICFIFCCNLTGYFLYFFFKQNLIALKNNKSFCLLKILII